jgi:hypothetical protein
LAERGLIPVFYVGKVMCARKTELRERLSAGGMRAGVNYLTR